MSKHRILIVEDEPAVADYLIRVLSNYFYVTIAASGREAVIKAREIGPACVLIDYRLPDMNGVILAMQILSFCLRVPIYIMSGADLSPIDADTCRQLDFRVVFKPFSNVLQLVFDIQDRLKADVS